jgi:hypothetical protein
VKGPEVKLLNGRASTIRHAARAHQIDIALATRHTSRAPIPKFVNAIAGYENDAPGAPEVSPEPADADETDPDAVVEDLVTFASNGSNHFDTRAN